MPKKLDCRLKINKSKSSCLKNKQDNKKYNKSKKVAKKTTKKVVKKTEKVGKCFADKVVIKKKY